MGYRKLRDFADGTFGNTIEKEILRERGLLDEDDELRFSDIRLVTRYDRDTGEYTIKIPSAQEIVERRERRKKNQTAKLGD